MKQIQKSRVSFFEISKMHSADNENKHDSKFVNELIGSCPRIAMNLDLSEGENYIFSQVAILISDLAITGDLLDCLFSHFNEMAKKEIDYQNILVVNVFEVLADTKEGVEVARGKLRGHAAELFERVLNGWCKE